MEDCCELDVVELPRPVEGWVELEKESEDGDVSPVEVVLDGLEEPVERAAYETATTIIARIKAVHNISPLVVTARRIAVTRCVL